MREGLETYVPDNLLVGGTRLILQEEVVSEERKVRRNLKENFTNVDKNGHLKNRIRVKMNKPNLIVVQESTKEIADWEIEPTLEEGGKHDNLICIGCRDVLTGGKVPLQHLAV
jgi:hypothetical protein